MDGLRIHSIFQSLDGEVNTWGQGIPSTFLRLQGCNLKCSYCDIPEAQDPGGGDEMTVEDVFQNIRTTGCPKITITGGEPLLQAKELHELLILLFKSSFSVSIETNGTFSPKVLQLGPPLFPFGYNIHFVMDYKLSSVIHPQGVFMYAENFQPLDSEDWVKFVIGSREDYEEAKDSIKLLQGAGCQARIAFSPVHETLPGKILADWILGDKLWNVTLNIQIQKFIGVS